MAVNDSDLELLHAYLDSELPVSECEGLWRRLAIERDLMGELDRLREDHAVRTMVWNSLEPDDSSIARLQAKLMRATRREDFTYWIGNAARIMLGYAQSWLLVHYLIKEPAALPRFRQYLQAIAPRVKSDRRIEDAQAHLGDLDQLDQELRRYAIRLQLWLR